MPTKKSKRNTRPAAVASSKTEHLSPRVVAEEMLRGNPWFGEIFEGQKTKIKILLLADGDITFSESKFGLSELINKALQPKTMIWEELKITTAHRSGSSKTGAELPDFKLTPETFNNQLYDQVWLFGHNRQIKNDDKCENHADALKDSELKLLAGFMNAGGGVFATGDHDDLGVALCGEVPRVQRMRKWFSCDLPATEKPPGLNDSTRIDTLREGLDQGFLAMDQADNVAQEIRPRFKMKIDNSDSEPHYLLRNGARTITVLPDHMHEGECLAPPWDELTASISLENGDSVKEFPKLPGSKDSVAPEVVAVSTSAGGYLKNEWDIKPVEPRCYNIIVAYDGHCVNVGRVVVDASFHHFVDINLKGTGINPIYKRRGLYDDNNEPTKDYLAIKQYFRNIVMWLCPPEVQTHYYMNMLLAIRYMSPLIEEIRPIGPIENLDWEDILYAGTVTRRAIAEQFAESEATQCALATAAMHTQKARLLLEAYLNPWSPCARQTDKSSLLFNFDVFVKAILGGAMLGIAGLLPQSSSEVSQELTNFKSKREAQLQGAVVSGASQGLKALFELIKQSNTRVKNFSKELGKSLVN